jgi:hypothetical protein
VAARARAARLSPDGQGFIAEVHEDTVGAGGVLGERGFELSGHQDMIARVSSRCSRQAHSSSREAKSRRDAAANAAAERLQVERSQALGKAQVPSQNHTEELARIEIFGSKDAKFVEDGGDGLLGFIDHQYRVHQGLRDVIAPPGAQDFESAPRSCEAIRTAKSRWCGFVGVRECR